MKTIKILVAVSILLSACSSAKYTNSVVSQNEFDRLVKKYNRKSSNTELYSYLYDQYNLKLTDLKTKIEAEQIVNTPESWEKTAELYKKLQELTDAVKSNQELYNGLKPANYTTNIASAKLTAADMYYSMALAEMDKSNVQSARNAHTYLTRVERLAGSYKETNILKQQAFKNGTIDILIQPLRRENGFFNSGYNSIMNNNWNSRDFSNQLVYDLGNNGKRMYKVYNSNSAWNVKDDIDMVIEPVLTDFRVYNNGSNNNTYQRSASIAAGKDTAGRTIYKTVYATVQVQTITYTGNGNLEMRVQSKDGIANEVRRLYDNVNFTIRTATYTGDSRALTSQDYEMINNRNNRIDDSYLEDQFLSRVYNDALYYIRHKAEQ
jgi:hypothetical protein